MDLREKARLFDKIVEYVLIVFATFSVGYTACVVIDFMITMCK